MAIGKRSFHKKCLLYIPDVSRSPDHESVIPLLTQNTSPPFAKKKDKKKPDSNSWCLHRQGKKCHTCNDHGNINKSMVDSGEPCAGHDLDFFHREDFSYPRRHQDKKWWVWRALSGHMLHFAWLNSGDEIWQFKGPNRFRHPHFDAKFLQTVARILKVGRWVGKHCLPAFMIRIIYIVHRIQEVFALKKIKIDYFL